MSDVNSIVVVGGGQAAAQAIASLRQGGYEGALTMVAEEAALPYQRPPLSKGYLKGDLEETRLYLRPAEWYEQAKVTLKLDSRITAINTEDKLVTDDKGEAYYYDRLIIATGSRPRPAPFPGADLAKVFDLRTLADVDKIRPEMQPGRKLVIVGAGYIGLEAAAVARTIGLDVTVVEMADRVLARVTSPEISEFYQSVHKTEGVNILLGESVEAFHGEGGALKTVSLSSGKSLEADTALIGIGILPNDGLARDAGLECGNGITVDRNAQTSDPSIYAIGDCACRPLVCYDRRGRLESVHNAIEQGKLAAASILGRPRPPEDCPWFWSDQYDLKLQIAGLSTGYDAYVIRGKPKERKFAIFYFKQNKLIAVDAINSPAEFLMSKKMVLAGAEPSREHIADTSVPIKEIAAECM
ncbi:MAG: ferredoxin reductase [Hyphococcus sp.]|nr:MAG: ferredoxin reductase [Marinicaulis sp.]